VQDDEGEDVEQTVKETLNIRDLMPHVDISSCITESLLSELADRDWNVSIFIFVTLLRQVSCIHMCFIDGYSDGYILHILVEKLH
jgi:hypothetical protein